VCPGGLQEINHLNNLNLMPTKIYKSYSDFCSRENKNENGVSEEFVASNPSWEKMNETNKGCWSCSGCSDCSDCSDKKGTFVIPVIENIHQKVLEAVSDPEALDMSTWHTCDTTHCRAGWVVTLAGEAGKKLEEETSTAFAAYQIYKKSSPIKVLFSRFYEKKR
jgi:hypothetical protein